MRNSRLTVTLGSSSEASRVRRAKLKQESRWIELIKLLWKFHSRPPFHPLSSFVVLANSTTLSTRPLSSSNSNFSQFNRPTQQLQRKSGAKPEGNQSPAGNQTRILVFSSSLLLFLRLLLEQIEGRDGQSLVYAEIEPNRMEIGNHFPALLAQQCTS